jgi:26S proteasome regulatory subunit N7
MFFVDNEMINQQIEVAKGMIDKGGDWDRRNRLKVYQGVYQMSIRDFKSAAENFLETLSTFTSTELLEYEEFVKYTILCSMISLSRVDIKKKLINSPEVLEVIHKIAPFETYMNSLYHCKYQDFFLSLSQIEPSIKLDRLLHHHYRYIAREMRIIAYHQLLESYRSLTLESMAHSFGVSEEFIDR